MNDSQLIAFTLAAAALTIAPGQDTMLVIRNVVRGGRRDGIATTFGICSGLFVHATLSALGVSILLTQSAAAFNAMKLAGALYLGWLGLQSLARAMRGSSLWNPADAPRDSSTPSSQRCFFEGLLSNLLNPKTAIFYLAFLPQFVSPSEPVLRKSLLLASIHYAEGIVWLAAVSVLFDRMQEFVLSSSVRRWLDGLCGTLLIAFGARLALARN